MRIRTAFPIAAMSGTIAANSAPQTGTFYSLNGQMVARKYARPSGTASTTQTDQQRWFALATAYWRNTLTDTQRAGWTAYAVANPVIINKQSVNVGGIGMFTRAAVHNQLLGLAIWGNPPPATAYPADPNTYALTSVALSTTPFDMVGVVVTGAPASKTPLYITVEITAPLIGSREATDAGYRYVRSTTAPHALMTTTTGDPVTNLGGPTSVGAVGQVHGYRVRMWGVQDPVPLREWTGKATVS